MAKDTNSEKTLRVRRGRVDSVILYEVKENELEILENGEQTNLQLNFSIFLFSISFSGIFTLLTATFTNALIQETFLLISICGFIIGLYLLLIWWKGRSSIKSVIKIIKDRIQPEEIDEGEEEIEIVKKTDKKINMSNIIPPAG